MSLTWGTFLDAFLPNLAATLVGVVVGVPVALAIAAWARSRQKEDERDARRERFQNAVDLLLRAGAHNLELLNAVPGTLKAGQYFTGFQADLSTWDIVRAEVLLGLTDVGLRVRLAHFYEGLALFVQHQERLVTNLIGATSDQKRNEVQVVLGAPLLPFAERLIDELERVQSDLRHDRDAP